MIESGRVPHDLACCQNLNSESVIEFPPIPDLVRVGGLGCGDRCLQFLKISLDKDLSIYNGVMQHVAPHQQTKHTQAPNPKSRGIPSKAHSTQTP